MRGRKKSNKRRQERKVEKLNTKKAKTKMV